VTPNLPDDGEVYRTAERLREASAIASLRVSMSPENKATTAILKALNLSSPVYDQPACCPPGITVDGRAMLLSPFARLILRFRSDPLAIEVIDIPHSREDGPALMVRIPGSGPDDERGSVFIADRLGDINLPNQLLRSPTVCAPARLINR
jgi:hypothetical protein